METKKTDAETITELSSKLSLIHNVKNKNGSILFKIENTSDKDIFFPFCNFNHAIHSDSTIPEGIRISIPQYPDSQYPDFVKIVSEYPIDLRHVRLSTDNNEQLEETIYFRTDLKDGSSKLIGFPLLMFVDTKQYQSNIVDIILPSDVKLSKKSDLCIDIRAKSCIQIFIDLDGKLNLFPNDNLIKLHKIFWDKLEVVEIKNKSSEFIDYDFSFFDENSNEKIEKRIMGIKSPNKSLIKEISSGLKNIYISRLYCSKDSSKYLFNNYTTVNDSKHRILKKIYLQDFKKSNHFQENIIDFNRDHIININSNSKTKKINFLIPPNSKIMFFVMVE